MLIPSQELAKGGPGRIGHIGVLDGVRAASILFVLAAHTLPLGFPQWKLNEVAGRCGMALFFCLSGFLITTILYRNPDPIAFLIKRLFRIVPAVYLYLVIIFVLFDLPLEGLLINFLFLQNYLVDYQSLGPLSHLWSLAVEVHFYLAIGLLAALFGRRALWLIPPAALVITGLRIDGGVVSNINTHLRADEILAGGCLALLSLHRGERLRAMLDHKKGVWVLAAVVFGLFLASGHKGAGWLVYVRPYLAAALVGLLLHSRIGIIHSVLESHAARHIANISYALYIYHPLMIWGWFNSGNLAERYLFKRPISYVMTWVAAYLSTRFWEKPWQSAARRILVRRDGAPGGSRG